MCQNILQSIKKILWFNIDEVDHNTNNIERREGGPTLMAIPDANLSIHIKESILIPQNPFNFVFHPIMESYSQLSTFVDATQVATDNEAPVASAIFLNNS